MMRINRDSILETLYQFSTSGSGLVIGKPGVGKTTLIKALSKKLTNDNRLSFVIKVDNVFNSSDEAIQAELSLDSNWIETFKSIKIKDGKKAVLIFDGFDAARDEQKRQGFLEQIKKALTFLSDKWTIIVSARSYDAQKSQDLKRLFPISQNDFSLNETRQFEIPELTYDEIGQLKETSPLIWEFYTTSNDELKQILKVPFFLCLLESIISSSNLNDVEKIKTFKSETQLLGEYWNLKIVETEGRISKETILQELTTRMVSDRILSIPLNSFLKDFNKSESDFEYLRGENIIDEMGHTSVRISYSHNILFDYAVSRYVLNDDLYYLIEFINKDNSRPFFLRPSFIYFFTALWHNDNQESFWKLYFNFSQNKQKAIQLFSRLIISTVIASELTLIRDIQPILEMKSDKRPQHIKNLLQSIRFVRNYTKYSDQQLLTEISSDLDINFLFEFGFLLERSLNDLPSRILDQGESARKYFNYILEQRKKENYKPFLDRIGPNRGIELVAKTYQSDIEESKQLLKQIFAMLSEPNFEIGYFSNLAEDVKFILPHDPSFVAEVYKVIFGHKEDSFDKTFMGGSALYSFIGNRKQDFDLCQFRLQILFPEFLIKSPKIAIPLAIEIANRYAINMRGKISNETTANFYFKDYQYTIVKDFSYLWSESRHQVDKPYELAYNIFEYFDNCIKNNSIEETKEYLNTFIKESEAAFLWRIFFDFLSKNTNYFAEEFLELALNPILLKTPEITFELKNFLKNASNTLGEEDKRKIEESIFKAFENSDEKDSIQEFLSIFPKEQLLLKISQDFMADKNILPNIRSGEVTTSISNYTTEDWLEDNGIELSKDENKELLKEIKVLETFNNEYLNKETALSAAPNIFDNLNSLFESVIHKKIDERFYLTAGNALAQAASIIIKSKCQLNDSQRTILEEILVYCFKIHTKYDDSNSQQSPAIGYSPTPRTYAAEALIELYIKVGNPYLRELIIEGANDASGPVRLNVLLNSQELFKYDYGLYNKLFKSRFNLETDDFIFGFLLSAIIFKKDNIDFEVDFVIEQTNKRVFGKSANRQLIEPYAQFLLYFANKNRSAFTTLENAYKAPDLCNVIIFEFFKNLRMPIVLEETSTSQIAQKFNLIHGYISKAAENLMNYDNLELNLEDPYVQDAIQVIDQVIIRIYFCLDPRSNLSEKTRNIDTKGFYFYVEPILNLILKLSGNISNGGFMLARTAHYFIQTLNILLPNDPKSILEMASNVTKYSFKAGYTLDSASIREIVKFTEILLADYREILLDDKSFAHLLDILDIYLNSGWMDALSLLWRLDEVFK